MKRLWLNDPTYPVDAAYLSRQVEIKPGAGNRYIYVNTTKNGIIIKEGTIIPILSAGEYKAYIFDADTDITTLDSGAFTLGTDYYVYLCDDGTAAGVVLISANSTAPVGYTADNSRKIGGFHYGRIRNSLVTSDITNGGVVPNSVWDLAHRPKSSPEGMVFIDAGFWVDIYLASVNEAIAFTNGNGSPISSGSCKSAYNTTPLTGTEGLSGYNFIELAMRSSKRLLSYGEWCQAAYGSPQGLDGSNDNAWSATTNTARQTTGYVPNAISMNNCIDCVGNVWEWLGDMANRESTTIAFAYYDVMPDQGAGQIYMASETGLNMYLAGGNWGNGVACGSRTLHANALPWHVSTDVGCRFASDSL